MWYIKETGFIAQHILAKICFYLVKVFFAVLSAMMFLLKMLLCVVGTIGMFVGMLGVMIFGFVLVVEWISNDSFSFAFSIAGWYMLIAFSISIGFGILRELGMHFPKKDV